MFESLGELQNLTSSLRVNFVTLWLCALPLFWAVHRQVKRSDRRQVFALSPICAVLGLPLDLAIGRYPVVCSVWADSFPAQTELPAGEACIAIGQCVQCVNVAVWV